MPLIKPYQALDPYMSLANTMAALWIICSALSLKPCARKTRSAYSVWAHVVITFWTCSDADKLFVRVTPRIFSTCTRCSSGIMTGAEKFAFRLLSTKIVSWLFAKLSLRLRPVCNTTELGRTWANVDSTNNNVCRRRIYRVHYHL